MNCETFLASRRFQRHVKYNIVARHDGLTRSNFKHLLLYAFIYYLFEPMQMNQVISALIVKQTVIGYSESVLRLVSEMFLLSDWPE